MSDSAATHSMIDASQRLPTIDAMRGIAVILVTLHHIHLRFQIRGYEVADLLPESIGRILFWSGYYSVIAFFVISGFLITRLSLHRWGSLAQVETGQFYRLRGARIFPCLLLLLATLSALHLAGFADYAIKPDRASLREALAAALTFHLNWLEGKHGYLPGNWDVLWSLSVEEAFYTLFPLVCFVLKRERWLLAALLVLIVVGPFNRIALEGQSPWDDYAYFSCMDGIAFGCIAGWLSVHARPSLIALRAMMLAGLAAVLLVVVFRTHAFELGLTKSGLNVSVLEFGVALILLAAGRGVGSSIFARNATLLRFVGRCSYEIYLTHMFIVLGLMHPFKRLFGAGDIHPAIYLTSYLTMLALSILLGHVVARFFSEPLNRKLRSRTPVHAPVLVSGG